MKPVRFLHPAEQEMLDAARYYELQASGLGNEFLNKIDIAIKDISQNPETWPIIHFKIRRRMIHRFPYSLFYRVDSDEIVILATMHLHIVSLLAFMVLSGINILERLRFEAPGEMGKLLGLDRIPEVKILRKKISLMWKLNIRTEKRRR